MLTKGRSGLIYQTKKLEHSLEIFFNSFLFDSALRGQQSKRLAPGDLLYIVFNFCSEGSPNY